MENERAGKGMERDKKGGVLGSRDKRCGKRSEEMRREAEKVG